MSVRALLCTKPFVLIVAGVSLLQFEQQLALKPSAFEQMRTVEAAAAEKVAKKEAAEAVAQRAAQAAEAHAAETDTLHVLCCPCSFYHTHCDDMIICHMKQMLERVRAEQERRKAVHQLHAVSRIGASPKLSAVNAGAGLASIPAIPSGSPALTAAVAPTMPPVQPQLSNSFSRFQSDFEVLGKLGKGGFGEVVKARNKLDGVVYAVKIIKVPTS